MASVIRLSRFTKIAAVSAIGGSFYLLRDEIKPYIFKDSRTKTTISPIEQPKPQTIPYLPERIPYLLVGAGTASHSAMRAIRGHDPNAKVLMIGSENHNPYMRPALSKELWISEKDLRRSLNFRWFSGKEKSIFFEIDEFFIPLENLEERGHGGVSLLKNTRLERLDPDNKTAYLENGQSIKYDKCLLATGGKPKTLPELENAQPGVKERVLYFRTADDFLKLDEISESAKRIVVIGGGFLGSELTCALTNRLAEDSVPSDQIIYQIFPESGNLGKVLPHYLSEWLSDRLRKDGARIIPNVELKLAKLSKNNSVEMELSNGQTIEADYIVCAVGLEPCIEMAKSSGLEVDEKSGGYLVNAELEARTDVWVAGDACCFYDTKLGRRRVEHHDHAINSGKQAGQNMTGAGKAYTHQSMFWSDLSTDISFEAVGIIDSGLKTVAVFADPHESILPKEEVNDHSEETEDKKVEDVETHTKKKSDEEPEKYGRGVIFYLDNDVVVGILLWNLFGRLSISRRILNEHTRYEDYNELAKLFNLYIE